MPPSDRDQEERMRHWLCKSEETCYSIADLERDGRAGWDSVRNYQARNFMRDQMKVGDLVLYYHSNAEPTGVAGIARVSRTGVPDPTQFDPRSEFHDPKSSREQPTWIMVEVEFVERFPEVVTLAALRAEKALQGMGVLARGNRLSVMPCDPDHFEHVRRMGRSAKSAAKAATKPATKAAPKPAMKPAKAEAARRGRAVRAR
jgi:predicted RNA-binding protein with PUA-like domain